VAWIALPLLLVIIAVAVVLVMHPFSHPAAHQVAGPGTAPSAPTGDAAASSAAPAGSASSGSPSPSPSATVTEQQAATKVASMLSQSRSDRSDIARAATDVATCGPSLANDQKVFDRAASSRKALLSSLGSLPGHATLPAALTGDLTKAWQASVAADQAYAQWAGDEVTKGCKPNDVADPGYQATKGPNGDATQDKTAFAAAWNPVAAKYHLTQYQPGQL
jgi:hypothetical protein